MNQDQLIDCGKMSHTNQSTNEHDFRIPSNPPTIGL